MYKSAGDVPPRFTEKHMSNVFQFTPKTPVIKEESAAVPMAAVNSSANIEAMNLASAAMTVVATLAFYANQGFDHGKKALHARESLNMLLNAKGFTLTETDELPASA